MKKEARTFSLVISLLLVFVLGWQGMPRVWQGIRGGTADSAVAQSESETTAEEPELYTPRSNTVWGEEMAVSDSVIYYFYKDYCPYCRELEPLTAGLPGEITLPDGTRSRVRLVCLNKVEETYAKIIAEYYEEYRIPEERQYVPAVVIGNRYLFPGYEIIDQLMNALAAGEGLQTPLLDGAERIPDPE